MREIKDLKKKLADVKKAYLSLKSENDLHSSDIKNLRDLLEDTTRTGVELQKEVISHFSSLWGKYLLITVDYDCLLRFIYKR